jgi:hypothetical protein
MHAAPVRALVAFAFVGTSVAHVIGLRGMTHSCSSLLSMGILHVYDPGASRELDAYLETHRCEQTEPFDSAPKLAHSIALELEEALDAAKLPIPGAPTGTVVLLSEVDDIGTAEACLAALGMPNGVTLVTRDFNALRDVGFCGETDSAVATALTLINGESVPGLRNSPNACSGALFDATTVLADELDEHFEFSVEATAVDGRDVVVPVLYGGRSPDGCIVGVLGMVTAATR